jgi:rhamnose transport system substrate-binding protein
MSVFKLKWLACAAALAVAGSVTSVRAEDIKIGLLVKNLGNRFYEAVNAGGQEAAKQLGGVEVIYTGPTAPTAEGQIEIINSLVAQKVNAIAISTNDPNAVVPAMKKAIDRGVMAMSFNSGVAPEGRLVQVFSSNPELIGRKQVQLIADAIGTDGEIAILSAGSTMANQNGWIVWMKKELEDPKYAKLKLVTTAYGDDQSDKSYREALGLLKSYPNLKGIISPTTVGIAAACKAIEDQKMVGKVYVTGLGLPSEMKAHVESGCSKSFTLWNPVDLGYAAVYTAYRLAKKEVKGAEGEVVDLGRLGKRTIDAKKEFVAGEPFVFDKSNINEFSKIF